MPPKLKGLIWLVVACLFGGLFAMGLSPLVKATPWHWEVALAQKIMPQLPVDLCDHNSKAQAALTKLVARLYPIRPDDDQFKIDVQIVDDDEVNAFAGLGGHIIINSALLEEAESPEEIAGILAHEIEHVHHRHVLDGVVIQLLTIQGLQFIFSNSTTPSPEWLKSLFNISYTRGQEKEADKDGLDRLKLARISYEGLKNFFDRFHDGRQLTSFMSDHPSMQARANMISAAEPYITKPIMTAVEWTDLHNYCRVRK